MMERISALERSVQQQADEILILRSALSDALRRLTTVEQPPAQPPQTPTQVASHHHQQVSQNYHSTPSRTIRRHEGKLSRRTYSSDGIHRMNTPSPSPSSGRLTPAKPMKKWPSFSPGDHHSSMNGGGIGGNSGVGGSFGGLTHSR